MSSSSIAPLAHVQPCASRPNASATITVSSNIAPPARANISTFWRSAAMRLLAFISGALILLRRGNSHSSNGAPISAVTEPVETSIHTRVSHRMIWSESQRINAPISGANIRRASRRRAPSIFANSGANRPIKPIIPTALTSKALITMASDNAARRASDSARPRLRATPSSSPISVIGRNNNSVSITPPRSCGHRRCTPLQSVCVSVPLLHKNMLCS